MTSLVARALLFVGLGSFAFAFLYVNLKWARPRVTDVLTSFVPREGAGMSVDLTSLVPKLLLAGALIVALITAAIASAQWMTVLMAIHGVPVGSVDPVLGRDIGFYLFRLPAISAALGTLVVLTILSLAGVLALYVMRGAVVLRQRASVEPAAARHIGALLVLLFVLFAAQLWMVDAAALLYSNTGPLAGASYADVHVSLPAIRLSAIVALLAAGSRGVRRGPAEARLVRGARRRDVRRSERRVSRSHPGDRAEVRRRAERAGA